MKHWTRASAVVVIALLLPLAQAQSNVRVRGTDGVRPPQ
jgi:hypothetical protein